MDGFSKFCFLFYFISTFLYSMLKTEKSGSHTSVPRFDISTSLKFHKMIFESVFQFIENENLVVLCCGVQVKKRIWRPHFVEEREKQTYSQCLQWGKNLKLDEVSHVFIAFSCKIFIYFSILYCIIKNSIFKAISFYHHSLRRYLDTSEYLIFR